MSTSEQQRLAAVDDLLCLALHAASRAMTARYRAILEPFGLTYPQYLVVHVLEQRGHSSLVAIGASLRLESSTLSPLVRRLEAMGLVTRTRSLDDERHVTIALTDAGSELSQRLAVVPDQISAATGMDAGQRDSLLHDLQRLEANLRGL